MNLERVEHIADAVLYEGYMLYPYRPSSVKNQRRWNFGVLCPPSYGDVETGSESSFMQTECLLRADSKTRLTVKVRFLQIVQRSIGRLMGAVSDGQESDDSDLEFVDRLELDGRVFQPWQEAVERELTYESLAPASLCSAPSLEFSFFEGNEREGLRDTRHRLQGMIVRQWQTLSGTVQIRTQTCRDDIVRLTVRVENQSHFDPSAADDSSGREAALPFSLVSVHAVLGVEEGEFISLLDPPAAIEDLAGQCQNKGTWPVLAGEDATAMLALPIILYDYPAIAPESAGNLFDATEIDEILSLRILTLTDEEKQEMRESDERAREVLARTESMPDEQFIKLHGILRRLGPVKGEPQ